MKGKRYHTNSWESETELPNALRYLSLLYPIKIHRGEFIRPTQIKHAIAAKFLLIFVNHGGKLLHY